VQPLPHACLLPRIEAAVAGRAGPKAELERQVPPRDPGMQHKQDPLQRRTIIEPPTTRVAEATLDPRQQRLDQPPQPIRHDPRRNSHRHPFQLDDGCRRRSSSGNGSLHSDSSSKRFAALADGGDLLAVLEQRIDLVELLRHKYTRLR
jgi:hypothetical protein